MCSGTHLLTSLVKPLSDTMGATYVSDRPRTMDSSTRWPLKIGTKLPHPCHHHIHFRCRAVTNAVYPALEKVSESAIKDKQKFERLVVPKETLLEMFAVRFMPLVVSSLWPDPWYSTTNTKSISSNLRSPMARPRQYTDVVPWSISVLAHISPTQEKSRHS